MNAGRPSEAMREVTRFIDRIVLPGVVLGLMLVLAVRGCSPSPQQQPQQQHMNHRKPNTDCQFNHQSSVHLPLLVSKDRQQWYGTFSALNHRFSGCQHPQLVCLQLPLAVFPVNA